MASSTDVTRARRRFFYPQDLKILLVSTAFALSLGAVGWGIAMSPLNRYVGLLLPLAFGVLWFATVVSVGLITKRASREAVVGSGPETETAMVCIPESADGEDSRAEVRQKVIAALRSAFRLCHSLDLPVDDIVAEARATSDLDST